MLRLPDELKQNCVDDIVDLMRRFVELLSSEHQAVVTEAASVVANIAASPGENSSSRVIDSGAVPLLIKLLGSTDKRAAGFSQRAAVRGGGGSGRIDLPW